MDVVPTVDIVGQRGVLDVTTDRHQQEALPIRHRRKSTAGIAALQAAFSLDRAPSVRPKIADSG
jgi:hypothetical protein